MSWNFDNPRRILGALSSAGYTPADALLAGGRPGHPVLALTSATGSPVIAKLYADGRGRAAYEHMAGLWASSFGERRDPPGVPRALDYLEGIGALIMERVNGQRLARRGLIQAGSVAAAVGLLAGLHASDARPSYRRTSQDVVRSMGRKTDRVSQLAPDFTEPFTSLVHALGAARPPTPVLVPSHGDFYPSNVLVCDDRLVLVDWDRYQWADPARDLGYFGAWMWARAVSAGRTPDWSVLEEATAVYQRLSTQPDVRERIPFYAAAGLARVGHILVKRPSRHGDLPAIIDEAHRILGRRDR